MATGTVSNITGLVSGSELDIINVKVLKNLKHRSLGTLVSATPDNPTVVQGGGTAVFKIQKFVKSQAYTAANRNTDDATVVKQEVAVKADIKEAIKLKYEIETLELPGLTFENRAAYINYIAAGLSMSVAALIDALVLELAVETAKASKATREIINADFADLNTAAKREAAYRQVARAGVDVARGIDEYNIGTDRQFYAT